MSSQKPTDEQPQQSVNVVANSDINSAAALRAQYAIQTPKMPRGRHKRHTRTEEDGPIVDNTAALLLHSKKTERLQKRQHKRSEKAANRPASMSLLDLPSEILVEIVGLLRVVDVFHLGRTSQTMQNFVDDHERGIAKDIIRRRYFTLYRCFPLPIAFKDVPEEFHAGLLSEKRQELLNIHRKPYQHLEGVDPHHTCTCMTCVFAWNNLCLLVDLHHWQHNLANREPIPMIPRGTNPQWNQDLLRRNADLVRHAMHRPFYYAAILEKHLATITGTILRFARWKKKGHTTAKPRLYHLTDWDLASGTDAFLDRSGPPSYDFPFHRDNYYSIEAYLPNRKFGNDAKWHYYALPPAQHEKDLEWVRSTFQSTVSTKERRAQALANLKDHNIRWSQYLEHVQQKLANLYEDGSGPSGCDSAYLSLENDNESSPCLGFLPTSTVKAKEQFKTAEVEKPVDVSNIV